MNQVLSFAHFVIGALLTSRLQSGELDPQDAMAKKFFVTCFSNETCVEFVAQYIASHFDVNVEDLTEYMVNAYNEGEEMLRGDDDE